LKNFRIKEPPKIQAFEKIRTRESLGLGIWKKNSNSKNCHFWVFQNFKEPLGFMKEPKKDNDFWGSCFKTFSNKLRTVVICNKWVFDFLISMIMYQNQVYEFIGNCDYQLIYPGWYPVQFLIPAPLWFISWSLFEQGNPGFVGFISRATFAMCLHVGTSL
jgi:hypothetical protein